jgi:hypothetical protein
MPKSHAKMLETLEELIEEYSAFQRSRPDLPQMTLFAEGRHGPKTIPASTSERNRGTHFLGPWLRYPARGFPA